MSPSTPDWLRWCALPFVLSAGCSSSASPADLPDAGHSMPQAHDAAWDGAREANPDVNRDAVSTDAGPLSLENEDFTTVDPSTIAGWNPASWSCPSATGDDVCLNEWLAAPSIADGGAAGLENAAFLVLVNGQIAYEWYNPKVPNGVNYSQTWASASKTLVGVLLGIAQEEGYLTLDDAVSKYLNPTGTTPWSSSPSNEAAVTLKHLMTHSSGFDTVATTTAAGPFNGGGQPCSNDDSEPQCNRYYGAPGAQFRYNTGLYGLLRSVLGIATGATCTASSSFADRQACFDAYFTAKLGSVLSLRGAWQNSAGAPTEWHFVGSARDGATFGYLLANGGAWNGTALVPSAYFAAMTSSNPFSQASDLANLSYGYLTWLAGKASGLSPASDPWATPPRLNWYPGPSTFAPAPTDAVMAIGSGGQYIHVTHHGSTGSPRASLVLVRLGSAPGGDIGQAELVTTIWQKWNRVMCNNAATSTSPCP